MFYFLQWTILPFFSVFVPLFMHKKNAIKTAETKEWQAAHLFMCIHYIMQVKWTNCLFAHNILFRRGKRRRRRRLKKGNSMKILYTSCVYYVDLQIYEKMIWFPCWKKHNKKFKRRKVRRKPTHPSIHTLTEEVSFVVEKHNDLNRNVISSCLFIHVSLWFEYFYYSHEKNDK